MFGKNLAFLLISNFTSEFSLFDSLNNMNNTHKPNCNTIDAVKRYVYSQYNGMAFRLVLLHEMI
jgi:hypothetical protein